MSAPAKPRILFVDEDLETLYQIRQMLSAKADAWEFLFAENAQTAMDMLIGQPVDVIVAEMHMKAMMGVQLLKQVGLCFPRTVRFIICKPEDKDIITERSGDLHQVLTRPLQADLLRARLESAVALNRWLPNDAVKEMVAKMRSFRSLPLLYLEVMKELQSPNTSAAAVGEIIAKDLAMTTKLLQTMNSAFFSQQQRISSPKEAVVILGLDTVRSLVLSVQAYAELDKVKPLYFSTDKLWRHSMAVAHRAKKLAQRVTNDERVADEAFTAGLFHDIGKLVLAANRAEAYSGAVALAKKRKIPLWEVETELFGASHAETGAYLLGLWGLPVSILEGIALHHGPLRSANNEFTPLTAVHVADVLEREQASDADGLAPPTIDLEYLTRLRLDDQLDLWRGTAPEELARQATESNPSAVLTPLLPVQSTKHDLQSLPTRIPWVLWPGLTVVLITLISWWTLAIARKQSNPVAVKGRIPAGIGAPGVLPRAGPYPTSATTAPESTKPSASTPSKIPQHLPSERPAMVEFKLQGIFYRKSNPSAVINGKTLRKGDKIDGARVVSIDRQSVKLMRTNQAIVLTLK